VDEDRVRRLAARYFEDAEAYEALWAPELRPLGGRIIEMIEAPEARRVLTSAPG
jgi:hypothetical protein